MAENTRNLEKPEVEHLYYVEVEVDPMHTVGKTYEGLYRIIPITGGRFEGERMTGTVRRIGADWNSMYANFPPNSHVTTRYVLETDDGALISLFTDGRLKFSLAGMMSLARGKPDPAKAYFRQHLYFKTGDPRYAWLNDRVCFAIVSFSRQGKVCYDAYLLK